MGFHQNQMSRQVIFLQTELSPQQRMLRPKFQIESLPEDSEDIYLQTKFETYLNRPVQLVPLTYPEFYQWWRSATPDEQKKGDKNHVIRSKGVDDFSGYENAMSEVENAKQSLNELLSQCDLQVENSYDLLALQRCLKNHDISPKVVQAVVEHYVHEGVDELCEVVCDDIESSVESSALAESIFNAVNFDLVSGLTSYHWLMVLVMS